MCPRRVCEGSTPSQCRKGTPVAGDSLADTSPRRLRSGTQWGASATEYALLIALIAVICVGAIRVLGSSSSSTFQQSADSLDRNDLGLPRADDGTEGEPSDGTGSGGGGGGGGEAPDPVGPVPTNPGSGGTDLNDASSSTSSIAPTTDPAISTTVPTVPSTAPTTAPPTTAGGHGRTVTIRSPQSEWTWFNANGQGGQGEWRAGITFTNPWIRHQYLDIEITKIHHDGTTSVSTVSGHYVAAGSSSTYFSWGNPMTLNASGTVTSGVLSMTIRVTRIETSDDAWRPVIFPGEGSGTVTAPRLR